MSNYLAIATVSAALQQLLTDPIGAAVTGAGVAFTRPDPADITAAQVNIFLYQITPNAAFRNTDLPTRRADASLVQRPLAAFDLHYLLTFHGDDSKLEPQRLMGAAVTALHAQPLLSAQNIQSAITSKPFKDILGNSDLGNQVERVKFTPAALSLEEFTKLWSVFFQVEYSLSAAYQASVVLMETSDNPQEAPPVMTRNLYVLPFQSPSISQVVNQAEVDLPITSSSTLLIQGQHLRGQSTLLLMEQQEFTPAPAAITDTQITLAVPSTIHAGIQGLQVVQKMTMGSDATPQHHGFESNVAPFVLRPTIVGTPTTGPATPPATGTAVTLTLAPNIGVGQRAILILNSLPGNPAAAYTSLPVVATADSNQITINIANVLPGSYLMRVQIDGAESLLTVDPVTKQFTGPTVAI